MAAFIDRVPETPFDIAPTFKKSRTSKRTTAKKGAKQQADPKANAPAEPVLLQEEQDPSAFFGKQAHKPVVRLADGKQVLIRDRLPNATVVDWAKHATYKDGGLKGAPKAHGTEHKEGQAEQGEVRELRPRRARAAWEFYAEELLAKATKANVDGGVAGGQMADKALTALRAAINEEVTGKTRRRKAAGTGMWETLSDGVKAKYEALAAAERERYQTELVAFRERAGELTEGTKAKGKKAAKPVVEGEEGEHEAAAGEQEAEEVQVAAKGTKGKAGAKAKKAKMSKQQEDEEEEEEKDGPASKRAKKASAPTKGKAAAAKPVKAKGKVQEEEAEAESESEDEEDEEYKSESSDDEDHVAEASESESEESEEEVEVQPAPKRGRKVTKPAATAASSARGRKTAAKQAAAEGAAKRKQLVEPRSPATQPNKRTRK